MTEKIVSRTLRRGDEKESEWPSQFGTGEKGFFHIDKKTGALEQGYPEPELVPYGEAPVVIMGEMKPQRHPMTGEVISNYRKWQATDKLYGLETVTKHEPANRAKADARRRKERAKERKEAMLKAVGQLEAGTAPLNEEQRYFCKLQNDIVSDALNFNAHDVVGRKNSEAGKKYRKRYKR